MTTPNAKEHRDDKFERAKNMRAVGAALNSLKDRFAALNPPIVRTSYLGPFNGAADDFSVRFIFRTSADVAAAEQSGASESAITMVREKLTSTGYPEAALETFRFSRASEEEIADAGGDFAFFR